MKKKRDRASEKGFLREEESSLSHRDLTGLAGAGSALIGGADAPEAVGTGIAARGFAGHVDADLQYQIQLRKKIEAEPNFWKRMKLRIIG